MNETEANVWARASLYGVEHGRVRRLRGFLKGAHHEPDGHTAATEAFVRKVGTDEVAERAAALHRQLRAAFGYKRRELAYTCEHGAATIETPAFAVHLAVEQDPTEARGYRLPLEVRAFRSPEIVTSEAFLSVFATHCDTVQVEFTEAVDLEATIDKLEEAPHLAPLLDYPADAAWLTLALPQPAITMCLRDGVVTFSIQRGGDLRQLVEGAQRLLEDCWHAGVGLGLPGR
ncbi:MAG: hypothetical protein ACLFU2_01395 [Opitutales bacterium]